jgi:hypothetical protein
MKFNNLNPTDSRLILCLSFKNPLVTSLIYPLHPQAAYE